MLLINFYFIEKLGQGSPRIDNIKQSKLMSKKIKY